MTNLKPITEGMNKFCGPAVLSILTGKSTDECAAVISRINGQYTIKGVQLTDLLKAAERLGFETKAETNVFGSSLYRTLISLVNKDGMYIVMVTGHFVCIEVKDKKIYFCDNHTKEPIPAASSARLSMEVLGAYKVTKSKNEEIFKEIDKIVEMSDEISEEFLQLLNLVNIAKHHREICRKLDCNVSLIVLKNTAITVMKKIVNNKEAIEAAKLINGTNWY